MPEPEDAIVIAVETEPAGLAFSADPASGSSHGGKVRRVARLFVAGEYPDKGVTVSRDDLHRIVAAFNAAGKPVPVKVEHHDGPLDPLGEVVALHVEGDELYGMLVFSEGMDSHLRERHVEYVSVCFVRDRDDSLQLKETSLVCAPRVPGAGFLSPNCVEEKLARFRHEGRLTPAMEPFVRRLLGAPREVAFSDGAGNVPAEVEGLLSALPVVLPRTLAAAAAPPAGLRFAVGCGSDSDDAGLPGALPEVERLARSFGLDPKRVAENLPGR